MYFSVGKAAGFFCFLHFTQKFFPDVTFVELITLCRRFLFGRCQNCPQNGGWIHCDINSDINCIFAISVSLNKISPPFVSKIYYHFRFVVNLGLKIYCLVALERRHIEQMTNALFADLSKTSLFV